ncbi:hypothetical protein [Marinifilum flexuosum]|nr:hypothetical protein [Marinifilum flexuosum]
MGKHEADMEIIHLYAGKYDITADFRGIFKEINALFVEKAIVN